MQSGLDRTWLFLPLLGRAAVGCAALACSGGAPTLAPAEPHSRASSAVIAVDAQSVHPAPTPSTSTMLATKPLTPAALIAGPARKLTWAQLMTRRSTSVVPEAKVTTFNLPLQCGGAFPCPSPQSNVLGWLQLDEHAPRPLSLGRSLISLLNEDEEIAPGDHTLFAALLSPQEVHADAASFRVEPARRSHASARAFQPAALGATQPAFAESLAPSACFLILPASTVNGQGEHALELLAVLLDIHDLGQVARSPAEQDGRAVVIHYTTTSDAGVAQGSFPHGTSALLERPAAGDVRIDVSCERDGKELARGGRTVTLNPELTGAKK